MYREDCDQSTQSCTGEGMVHGGSIATKRYIQVFFPYQYAIYVHLGAITETPDPYQLHYVQLL